MVALASESPMPTPQLYHNNPIVLQENQIFFLHIILMHSETNTAMNIGETYIVKKKNCERLGNLSLELVIG